jgi:5-formyltetrahydrofolate cyclo-ligase
MVRDGTGGWRLYPATMARVARVNAVDATRRSMRALRRSLPPPVRQAAERAIRAQLRRLGIWQPGRRIAAYLPFGGEVDVTPAFSDAWRRGVKLFVPHITNRRRGTMSFVPLTAQSTFRHNEYGIAEPAAGREKQIFLRELDVVLLPMVAFDVRGHRLGMGAGYYDRALRRRLDRERAWRRPRLIGVAFAAQQVDVIEPAPWDVAVDFIVTERGVLRCST